MARFLKDNKKSLGLAPGSLVFIGHQKLENSKVKVLKYNSEFFKEEYTDSLENIEGYVMRLRDCHSRNFRP